MRRILWLSLLVLVVSACNPIQGSRPASTERPTLTERPADAPSVPSPAPETSDSEGVPPVGAESEFSTDFSQHSVPYNEILSGGPPKDGIPAIDIPRFIGVEEADMWLNPQEPVIFLKIGEQARAYPIQILIWHEIVNDVIDETPVAVSYCPLCNTAIAFKSEIDGMILDFGTTGRLRYSNLIMYDRQTESWWQQATGEAIAGKFTGKQLSFLPAVIIPWKDFKANHPNGTVLSRETGYERNYGQNPYIGYDDANRMPFLYQGPTTPSALPPMARVLTIDLKGESVAYPYETLTALQVINDQIGGTPVVVLWKSGTVSALDAGRIAEGRNIGSAVAFSREHRGQILTFTYNEGHIVDEETGSTWDATGRAIAGPQAGGQLESIVSVNHFWFSWAAFKPETRIYHSTEVPLAQNSSPVSQVTSLSSDVVIQLYQGETLLGGEEIKLSEILAQGKPVILQFWAGLCPFCREEMPEIQSAYEQYQDEIFVVGVDIGSFTGLGDEEDARALLAELGITFPAGTTRDITAVQVYKVTGVPTTLFFKPNGELVDQWQGILTKAQISDAIDALLEMSR